MTSPSRTEHFVTLFDSAFFPAGFCLHRSLMKFAQPFRLWVICLDELSAGVLKDLALPSVTPLPLPAFETPDLLRVKGERSTIEYYWTLTPFTFQWVFEQDAEVHRVTYLDADLYIFKSPSVLLDEMSDDSHVLVTEHAYGPQYDQTDTAGRFCVQFTSFRRSAPAQRIMQWWQDRCLDWCYNRVEPGRFGDQKYLDEWPSLFGDDLHIVRQRELTLAPWNIRHFYANHGPYFPVFYHFHGLRMASPHVIRLSHGYRLPRESRHLYRVYLRDFIRGIKAARLHGVEPSRLLTLPEEEAQISFSERRRRVLKHKTEMWSFHCPVLPSLFAIL